MCISQSFATKHCSLVSAPKRWGFNTIIWDFKKVTIFAWMFCTVCDHLCYTAGRLASLASLDDPPKFSQPDLPEKISIARLVNITPWFFVFVRYHLYLRQHDLAWYHRTIVPVGFKKQQTLLLYWARQELLEGHRPHMLPVPLGEVMARIYNSGGVISSFNGNTHG